MSVSKYIRDNYSHSTVSYSLDDDEDLVTTDGVGKQHKNANEPSLEIDDDDYPDEGVDIGTERQQWRVNNEYSEANEEDNLVNNGTYKPNPRAVRMNDAMREWLLSDDDDYQDFNTEDDDE